MTPDWTVDSLSSNSDVEEAGHLADPDNEDGCQNDRSSTVTMFY